VPTFRPGFSEDHYVEVVARLKDVASGGSFDANDVLRAHVQELDPALGNAGDVAAVISDLEELGHIRPIGGHPPRWELVSDPGGGPPGKR
jgi:hypothetical protein